MVFNVRKSNRKIITDLPRKVKKIENIWIPMKDGVKLSATIWLPENAEENPVPALLEYIPYRKTDATALRDSLRHPYFAGHGYASIRVDIRGSGESEGIMYDEYLKQEQDDALEVLDWICQQPWHTNGVGMFGKSWGGFNSLQIAARNHPALKAIMTICSTDDRYADDVHYKGGAVLASDMLWWASTMLAYNARPQDPQLVGDVWKENWIERLDKTPPFVYEWMRHQTRDAYWKHGSICENYDDIQIPVYAVGGWEDGYTNAVFRMLENLNVPRKGLIGPWTHEYPEMAVPGPQIGFLQEALRWWDHWLKGKETAIMDEPMLKAYMNDGYTPQTYADYREGKWVAEENWQQQSQQCEPLYLQSNGQLTEQPATHHSSVHITSAQQHGLYAGVFCPFGLEGELPADQRMENGYATCFQTTPLEENLPLLGFPKLHVQFSSDQPLANFIVRLNDVAPDGQVTRMSWGVLNLTHMNSHEFPEKLVPHEQYEATITLNAVGYRIKKGHRIQVALSPTYWPHIWPSKEEATITVNLNDKTNLVLPVREDQEIDDNVQFEQPETTPVLEIDQLHDPSHSRNISYDVTTQQWTLVDYTDEGIRKLKTNGIESGSISHNVYTIREGDPLSAAVNCDWEIYVGRDEWQTKVVTNSRMTADENYFYLANKVVAYHNDEEVFSKETTEEIPRNHV